MQPIAPSPVNREFDPSPWLVADRWSKAKTKVKNGQGASKTKIRGG